MKQSARVVLCLLLALACAHAGTFEEGVAAYQNEQFATALELWLPLAQQGHRAAQFNVAVLYEKSQGVAQDFAEAARWYAAAAGQGDVDAQYALGLLYENGTGVARDVDKARQWYRASIANRDNDAASASVKERARERLAALSDAEPAPAQPTSKQKLVAHRGGRFVLVESADGSCVVALHGQIRNDTARRFDEVIREVRKDGCADPLLLLESPGGLLFDALDMGEKVRRAGFRTIARASCASACAMLFLAGTERTLLGPRAAIGLHQPAVESDRSSTCDRTTYTSAARDTASYIRTMIPAHADEIIKLVRETSCDKIEWIFGQRAMLLGVATRLERSAGNAGSASSAK